MKTEQRVIRFGMIGCGKMALTVHGPNLAAMPGVEVKAFCDLEESQAHKVQQLFGTGYVTTRLEDVLQDPEIDAVTITVGPKAHPSLVQAAARAGKHIFVEKPLAVTIEDALATAKVVEDAGVKFIHGTCNRLAPMVRIAKRACPTPLYSFAHSGSTVTHQAVHQIDLAINLFHDSPLERVYASGGQMWGLSADKHLPADSYFAVLTFADGSTHTYFQHGNVYNTFHGKYHFELYGKTDCVFVAKRYKECHHMRDGKVERSWVFEGSDSDRGPLGYMGHYDELADLVACIRNGGTPAMTVRDAAYTNAVENAILKSIETKAVVEIAPYLESYGGAFLLKKRA